MSAAPAAGAAAAAAAAGARPPAAAPDARLRLLCLHGYTQSADVFRARIGSMRKALKSRAEFFFLDAPFEAEAPPPPAAAAGAGAEPDDGGGGGGAAAGRAWWRWRDLEAGRPSAAAEYLGWHASQAAIAAALRAHAPIHGLLGFSQGATAAALYLAHAAAAAAGAGGAGAAEPLEPLRCAILVAGFLPRDAAHAAALRGAAPALPSLHVFGGADALVDEARSRALAACFPRARLYRHGGGHSVPTASGDFKRELVEFLQQCGGGPG